MPVKRCLSPLHPHLLLLVMLSLLLPTVSAEIYYIQPPNSTLPCPDPDNDHCRTLEEYAAQPLDNVVDMTFLFLEGEHPLSRDFSLSNISSVSLTYQEDSGEVNVSCSGGGKFVFENIDNVIFSNLTMLGCYGNQIVGANSFALDNVSIRGLPTSDIDMDPENSVFDTLDSCIEASSTHVLSIHANSILITRTKFENNFVDFNTTLVCVRSHNITMESTVFLNNAAASMLHVQESNFDLLNSHFLQNNVLTTMYSYESNSTILECDFTGTSGSKGGVLSAHKSDVTVLQSNFSSNFATNFGGAFFISQSEFEIEGCTFMNNSANSAYDTGAALDIHDSTVTITSSIFTQNLAKSGCIYAIDSEIHVYSSQFLSNTAIYGGAFTIRETQIYFNNYNHSCDVMVEFFNNSAQYGGAMNIIDSSVATIRCAVFTNNSAGETNDSRGGAILARTNTKVSLIDTQFYGNTAGKGGMLFAQFATLNSSGYLDIQNNSGQSFSIYLTNCTADFVGNLSFTNNHKPLLVHYSTVTFTGVSLFASDPASRKKTGAITSVRSDINIHGILTAQGNRGENGGAMFLIQSSLNVYGQCNLLDNTASKNGGAIHAYETTLSFVGVTNFRNNRADENGGAISMDGSTIQHHSGRVSFTENHAELGGAIYFRSGSNLHIFKHTMECDIDTWYCISDRDMWQALNFANNSAEKGGALYVDDVAANSCSSSFKVDTFDFFHDECFIQSIAAYTSASDWNTTTANFANIYFTNNTANVSGAVLYGGLLDRCTLDQFAEIIQIEGPTDDAVSYFELISGTTSLDIASDPLRVCLCGEDDEVDCDTMVTTELTVVPGKVFNDLKFAVVDQRGAPFNNSHKIIASLSSESSRLEEGESQQTLERMCSKLNFTIYSNDSVNLTLYAKDSPCTDGISKLILQLDINLDSECPLGFSLSNTSLGCGCDPELTDYVTNCNVQNNSVQRQGNTWISFPHGNDSNDDSDILVHDYCPYDYCRPPSENAAFWFNLSDTNGSDAQCAFNRTGQLCGCCQDGYSLTLGGSECRLCTNTGLVLIIPFALAGIALVLVMIVCNLTLATGTINGPLFYANILIANRFVFFPQHKLSIPLQVFVSMLGLNLGITTCFYDGLDGLGKIFLQIAFEAYLIFLVVVVILMGRSVRVSNFFHKFNFYPLHTLATLIVLSYEKLSRKIFSLFAFTSLHYTHNNTAADSIWLFYPCEGSQVWRQVILYIIGAVIIAAGLALNFILLFNKCIVGKCRSVYFNTFMVAFNAPFKPNHQYWVGLLLLIRNISYIVCDTFNAGKNPTDSLHFIFTLIIGLLLLKFFYAGMSSLKVSLTSFKKLVSNREESQPELESIDLDDRGRDPIEERSGIVYKNPYVDFLETSFLVNLLLLTYFTLYFREDVVKNQNNQAVLFTVSSAVVLITVIGILVYHTWVYTGVSSLCCKKKQDNNMTQQRVVKADEGISLHEGYNAYGTGMPTHSEVDTRSL